MNLAMFPSQLPALAIMGLGIATAVAPCPLATNIAALSYIGRKVTDRRWVLLSGILYTVGRSLTYFALAAVIVTGLTNLPGLATTLQHFGHLFLGPIFILVGMLLLGLIKPPLPQANAQQAQILADRWGLLGALFLGILFALAFCPTSAAYFGAVITMLSSKSTSTLWLTVLYGAATGLPVFLFAVFIALGVQWMGKAFQILTVVDRVVRTGVGVIFIVLGVYFILLHNFDLPINVFQLFR
ncbi:MAG: aromatic aminobenezylarsenical efflux permease ArsG family transporter [Thermogutta sp.]